MKPSATAEQTKTKWERRARFRLNTLMTEHQRALNKGLSPRDRGWRSYSLSQLAADTGLSRRTLKMMSDDRLAEAPMYVLARLYNHFGLNSWDQLIEFVDADETEDHLDHRQVHSFGYALVV